MQRFSIYPTFLSFLTVSRREPRLRNTLQRSSHIKRGISFQKDRELKRPRMVESSRFCRTKYKARRMGIYNLSPLKRLNLQYPSRKSLPAPLPIIVKAFFSVATAHWICLRFFFSTSSSLRPVSDHLSLDRYGWEGESLPCAAIDPSYCLSYCGLHCLHCQPVPQHH